MQLKKFTSFITVLTVIFINLPVAQADYYSDVLSSNKYYNSIEFFTSKGFFTGYPDFTFQPDRMVNRAEFLKMVMQVTSTPTEQSGSTGFPDVDENSWYAPYVKKALNLGWIQGYEDHTFKPEQYISKVEGVKIIAKASGWTIPDSITVKPYNDIPVDTWFATYISYAKEHNYLEETGVNYIPDASLSRGKVSDILFRSYLTKETGNTTYSANLITQVKTAPAQAATPVIPETSPINFTPVINETVSSDFFENIKLSDSFPNTYYLNEVYYFEGQITSGSYDKILMFLAPENQTNQANFINFVGDVKNNSFRVPVIFRNPGNYRLGIIRGTSGESSVADISVLPQLPASSNSVSGIAPNNLKYIFRNQNSTISWNNNGNELIKLVIYQGTNTRQFIFRQNISSFNTNYTDFQGFSEGKTYMYLGGADLSSQKPLQINSNFSASETISFNIIEHQFCQNDTDKVSISGFPETLPGIQTIRFGGTANSTLVKEAAIIKPDGNVETIKLTTPATDAIKSGETFSFAYRPDRLGTYIVEINTDNGEAAFNCPVYISTALPLTPDFFDLNKNISSQPKSDLAALRNQMLNLINAERKKMGLQPVSLDPKLNNLAQLHSEDMVERNFFSHINPDGASPEDRRIALNISTPVGENLAESPTLLYAHKGLLRSGVHRQNIITASWSYLGIGIDWDSNGQMFVTQEFTEKPLTLIDLTNLRNSIIEKINVLRKEKGISSIELDETLSPIAENWSQLMATENFFGFDSPNGETLSALVQKSVTNKSIQALILESATKENLTEEVLSVSEILNGNWNKIAIGIRTDNIGVLKATLLFTTY